MMKKTALALAAVAAVSAVAIAPADARMRRGPGPGLAFGAVAGALALGAAAAAASQPRYYYPSQGYYPYSNGSSSCNAYIDTVCGGPYSYAPTYAPGGYYSPY